MLRLKLIKELSLRRLFIAFICALCLAELVLRIFPALYIAPLSKTIRIFDSDCRIHHPSDNSELVYEPDHVNSLTDSDSVHQLETKYSKRSVNLNSFGFRGPEVETDKPDGVFRIVVLGDTNTYGVLVSDADTYPAVMERLLNQKFPDRRFEVINAGVCDYVLSQKSEYGAYIAHTFNPDLVVFQVHNMGRRAFWPFQNLYDYLSVNRKLMIENIPCALSLDWSLSVWHERLLWYSALYRGLNVWLNCWILNEDGVPETNSINKPFSPARAAFLEKVTTVGDKNSWFMFEQFLSSFSWIPVVFFDPAGTFPETHYIGVETIVLDADGKANEYRDILPPTYVYEWYAAELIRELVERGFIEE